MAKELNEVHQPKDFEDAKRVIAELNQQVNLLSNTQPVRQLAQPIKISSKYAKTGFLGVDEFSYRERRQRYFARRRALDDLYTIAFNVASIRTATLNLRNEIFRRGLKFEEKFSRKCTNLNCGMEYEEDVKVCSKCGMPTREPDHRQTQRALDFFKCVNKFKQSFVEVVKECEDDVQIVDDAFMLMSLTYQMKDGDIDSVRVDSIERLDPLFTEFDLNQEGYPEQRSWFCLRHRGAVQSGPGRCKEVEVGPDGEKTVCGCRLYPAMYKYRYRGAWRYYLDCEVIHWSKYSPSKTYGFSPIFSLYEKALTLIGMDRFLYDYFYERQLPVGILGITTDNPEALEEKRREWQMEIEENPHFIPMLGIDSQSGHGKVEWIKLGYTLEELDYLPIRDEIRQRISGVYGVTAVFQGAPQDVRGANAQQVQLVVQSRVTEVAQAVYNEKVFPRVCQLFGITDWDLHMITPEERSEEQEWQVKNLKAQYMQTMVNAGFRAKLTPKGEFIFDGEASRPGEMQPTPGELLPGEGDAMGFPGQDEDIGPAAYNQNVMSPEAYTSGDSPDQKMLLSKADHPRYPKGTINLGDHLEALLYRMFNRSVNDVLKDIKPWMSRDEAIKTVIKALDAWEANADEETRELLRQLFKAGIRQGLTEGGMIPSKTRDDMALKWLAERPTGFIPALSTFTDGIRKEFERVITESFRDKTPDLQRMTMEIRKVVDDQADWQIRRILRTEVSKVSNEGRILAWESDPDRDDYEYHWIAKRDHRTKEISKVLADNGPYTFEQIKKLWRTPTKQTAASMGLQGVERIPEHDANDIYHQRCGITRMLKS